MQGYRNRPEEYNIYKSKEWKLFAYENIICGYLDGNKKAKRVLDKLGFKAYEIEEDAFISEKGNKLSSGWRTKRKQRDHRSGSWKSFFWFFLPRTRERQVKGREKG